MTDQQTRYLDAFPGWLRSLGDDATALGRVVEDGALRGDAAELIVGGLNYLFKSLDLIPDGIDDIGYLDDAFVLRVAAELAQRSDLTDTPEPVRELLSRLAGDADLVREFLEGEHPRLEHYVGGLRRGAARGRTVGEIVSDETVRREFLSELRAFASSYEAPAFAREAKTLIKLRAFFDAKLPR